MLMTSLLVTQLFCLQTISRLVFGAYASTARVFYSCS
jgi:hypothetical protein